MTSTPTSTGPDKADQAAIAAVPARMVAAWREHDSKAFAGLFAENGTMILPGVFRQGRTAIEEFMAHAYQGPYKGTTVTGQPIEIKPLADGAVAVLTEGGVIAAGADGLDPADAIRASWILVKRDGEWVLAVYQNCPRDPA
ncbi:hypothetical protein Ait01nite_036340 [Actinoplanes italicus]|uniref:Uncharacterized protein (TIGR02246 family) n=1 Tax=Actinoplanes italicus TaxID=113567 RepID=A0A2T0K9C9_9ACTN|nr:SgcJ/EcaC family oxidoreductase [Actinoplanes italicus]PRX19396.1 uncharacterized protein (TIGR02246 family) [Actinoplanes italicus]GIE30589.1 hypothetical protein Ait01nite_036340 [Actinoplanes italicus]